MVRARASLRLIAAPHCCAPSIAAPHRCGCPSRTPPLLLLSPPRHPQEEEYAERVAKSRQLQSSIGTFWRDRRSTREMDEVYDTLLRSGNSSPTKRHYELTGALAQEEARRDPQYARTRALLQGVGAEGSISAGGGEGRATRESGTPGGGAQGGGERAPERGGSAVAAGGGPAPEPVLPER